MTDAVAIALITGGFGAITTVVTTVGTIISRKARDAALVAAKKVDEVRAQAKENGDISKANYATLTEVAKNTDGNVKKLQEAWAAEARRREDAAWTAAFEAGRRAEMKKLRRATDPPVESVNEEEPRE